MNAPDHGAGAVHAASTDRVSADDAVDAEPDPDPTGRTRLRQLADEQAALRRVATLVARGVPPDEVFGAVAGEVGRLISADETVIVRLEPADGGPPGKPGPAAGPEKPGEATGAGAAAGSVIVVARRGGAESVVRVGSRWKLEPGMAMLAALRTGGPVRLAGIKLATGPFGAFVREAGHKASVATPIVVDGSYWGVMVAATRRDDFPAGAGRRMAGFTELVATAIANAEADAELRRLAGTQAALRRVATLVARGVPPAEVFAAVTAEARRLFGAGTARMLRFDADGMATVLANDGPGPVLQVGERWDDPPGGVVTAILRTGQVARVDDISTIPGIETILREGIRAVIGTPILADGRLWGTIIVGAAHPMPPGTEQRMADFTDLVATAIANAQSRAEVTISRARIVTASDETRRRIERDLHDGAQQRLVSLALRLRSAASTAPPECEDCRAEINDVASGLVGVLDELREISHGIHPAILSQTGLRSALRALGRRSAIPVDIDVRIGARLPEPVEVAAYYVVSEMVTNAAKHARASMVEVDAETSGGVLRVCVRDDGVGGADPARGSGLLGLKDRIETLGGTFSVSSPRGGGTTVCCELPATVASAGF
jgi:signal transduction histidine kinase